MHNVTDDELRSAYDLGIGRSAAALRLACMREITRVFNISATLGAISVSKRLDVQYHKLMEQCVRLSSESVAPEPEPEPEPGPEPEREPVPGLELEQAR